MGISITLISCMFYVATWEILYFNFMPDFMDNYGAHTIEKLKASGASPEAVQVQVQKLKEFKEQYKNPLFNSLMTFIEPFPVGLGITPLSAAVLRKRRNRNRHNYPRRLLNKPVPENLLIASPGVAVDVRMSKARIAVNSASSCAVRTPSACITRRPVARCSAHFSCARC